MKRIISVVLAVILVLSLAACGGPSGSTPDNKAENAAGNVAEQTNDKDNAAGNDAETENTENTAVEPSNDTENDNDDEEVYAGKDAEYTVKDLVIVDNDNCRLTMVSGEAGTYGGAEFQMLLENKTKDRSLTFNIDDIAVNGWMVDTFFVETVDAGKKAEESMSFTSEDFKNCVEIAADEIEFSLRVYDGDDLGADDLVNDVFTVYPTGLSEAEVKSPEKPEGTDEMVAVDKETCTFTILGTGEDAFWGYTVYAYAENKTDKTLYFDWKNVSVNGSGLDPHYFGSSITPGNKALVAVYFNDSALEQKGIEDVKEIEFNLLVFAPEDLKGDAFVNEVFKYEPKH